MLCSHLMSPVAYIPTPSPSYTSYNIQKNTDEWFQRKSGKRDAEYKAAAIAMKDELRDAMMSPEELEAKTRVGKYYVYVCYCYIVSY